MFSKELFSFYEGKRVLICGASGLTGHNLYDAMQVLGAKVTGTCHKNQEFYADGKPMFEQADLTKYDDTDFVMSQAKPEYVFICCAQTYNAAVCRDNPQLLILPNITMVSNILEASLRHGVKKVLFVSSATVYQPHATPIAESALDLNIPPSKLYLGVGWAKRYCEQLCQFYASRGLACVVVRPTNIYGRYDKTDLEKCHVLPAFIMRGLRGDNPFIVKSLGNGIKNFIHVNDLIRDMAKVMMLHPSPDPINLTSDEYHSIGQVVDLVIKHLMARDPSYKPFVRFEGNFDAISYVGLNRNKLDSLYGKESYIPLSAGIKEVIEWYSLSHQTQSA